MAAQFHSLLPHPLLWRASGIPSTSAETISTGYEALDEILPGKGWPRQGLIEILGEQAVGSELQLLTPLLKTFFSAESGIQDLSVDLSRPLSGSNFLFSNSRAAETAANHLLGWITPPLQPYAPALAICNININNIFVVRTDQTLWATEQVLQSAVCRVVLAWIDHAPFKSLRRLQLAAEKNKTLGFLIRPIRYRNQPSPAVLRLIVHEQNVHEQSLKITIIKSRGGHLGGVTIFGNASA